MAENLLPWSVVRSACQARPELYKHLSGSGFLLNQRLYKIGSAPSTPSDRFSLATIAPRHALGQQFGFPVREGAVRAVRYHDNGCGWRAGMLGGTTERFSLEPGSWYALELLGEEFGDEIRSYSPIRVEQVTPRGGHRFSLAFYHANYPEGVRSKVYELETLERNAAFILARSVSHTPTRLMLIHPVTRKWLKEHFDVAVAESEDLQTWLTRNA